MQKLGDAFPESDKRERVERHFDTGRVLYLNWNLTKGPRDKYSLLICPDAPPLFLLFNTEMAAFIIKSPKLRDCQVPISPDVDPTAIRDECFLDCTHVKSMSLDEVVAQVNRDPEDRILGTLSKETLKKAYMALSKDKVIALGLKVRMLNALRPLITLP